MHISNHGSVRLRKSTHFKMIFLSTLILIGTGLFFGSAKSIHLTGPSIILSYIIGGIVMYIIMRALGEMCVHTPSSGSFSQYAHKYINNYAGFIAGWNAWFEYTVVCMVELTAVTFFLDYWFHGIPHWLICLVILIIFSAINLISVKFFGEFEFWFTGIKIVTIILMLLFSAYLIFFTHNINPDLDLYLNPHLFFANGYHAFLISLVIVVFSFGGTEFISIAAGEAINPEKNIPRAINGVIIRIILFYVLTMCAIICLYPYQKLATNISPFVDVFHKIGINSAAQIMNLIAITAALSAFNSCLYSSSRMLYNLAINQNAHKKFTKTSANGVPYLAVLATGIAILLAVVVNFLFPEKAIMYLLTIATCSILITWTVILVSQFRFRQFHIGKKDKIHFKLPLFPYSNIFAIVMLFIIMLVMTTMDDMRLSVFITPIWILLLSILYLIRTKKKT